MNVTVFGDRDLDRLLIHSLASHFRNLQPFFSLGGDIHHILHIRLDICHIDSPFLAHGEMVRVDGEQVSGRLSYTDGVLRAAAGESHIGGAGFVSVVRLHAQQGLAAAVETGRWGKAYPVGGADGLPGLRCGENQFYIIACNVGFNGFGAFEYDGVAFFPGFNRLIVFFAGQAEQGGRKYEEILFHKLSFYLVPNSKTQWLV